MSLLKFSAMVRPKKPSKTSKKGVVALEFAAGFAAFWGMCLLWLEMSYVSYVSALGDLLISNASYYAKLNPNDLSDQNQLNFNDDFKKIIAEQDSLWSSIVSADGFTTNITYLKNYQELAQLNPDVCLLVPENEQCGNPIGSPIAIYRINYKYEPIFAKFFNASTDIFSREMIVIQEYQRQ